MNSKRGLMTVLVGLGDAGDAAGGGRHDHRYYQLACAQSFRAAANVASGVVTSTTLATAPPARPSAATIVAMAGANAYRHTATVNYGTRGYYAAPAYGGPGVRRSLCIAGYGGGYGGGTDAARRSAS